MIIFSIIFIKILKVTYRKVGMALKKNALYFSSFHARRLH